MEVTRVLGLDPTAYQSLSQTLFAGEYGIDSGVGGSGIGSSSNILNSNTTQMMSPYTTTRTEMEFKSPDSDYYNTSSGVSGIGSGGGGSDMNIYVRITSSGGVVGNKYNPITPTTTAGTTGAGGSSSVKTPGSKGSWSRSKRSGGGGRKYGGGSAYGGGSSSRSVLGSSQSSMVNYR